MPLAPKILVVDDEPDIFALLQATLEPAGFECHPAEDVSQAEQLIQSLRPELVLLDWLLPSTSGLELLRRLRQDKATHLLPVIMLSARVSVDDRALALDAGADDYVCKPFSCRELRARVEAVLRRAAVMGSDAPERVRRGPLTLDLTAHRVWLTEREIPLSPQEFDLLAFLVAHEGAACSRQTLLQQVGSSHRNRLERTVDVHIARLRKALAEGGGDGMIETVRGRGYRFSISKASGFLPQQEA